MNGSPVMIRTYGRCSRNPKSETRNPKQILMTEVQNSKTVCLRLSQEKRPVWKIGLLDFDIVSDFEFRISELGSLINFGWRGLFSHFLRLGDSAAWFAILFCLLLGFEDLSSAPAIAREKTNSLLSVRLVPE